MYLPKDVDIHAQTSMEKMGVTPGMPWDEAGDKIISHLINCQGRAILDFYQVMTGGIINSSDSRLLEWGRGIILPLVSKEVAKATEGINKLAEKLLPKSV